MLPLNDVILPRAGRAPLAPACVHELPPRYEDEGSVRESRGAVAVSDDAWWSASLAVPIGDEGAAPAVVLRAKRHGASDARGLSGAGLEVLLPAAELDAVVALLTGVVAQARRDGVLPDAA